MKLDKIVRKVALDLMPVGTMVERMRLNNPIVKIGERALVEGLGKRNSIIVSDYSFYPENFRVAKGAD